MVSRHYTSTVIVADLHAPVYPEKGFTAWVCVTLIWLFVGLSLVGIYPVWEARHGVMDIVRGIRADIAKRRA